MAVVESKELLSFKLLDATVDASVAGPSASSRDPVLTVGAAIQDLSIRDLQADAHCTMVLQPNAPADSCSLALEFNQWADSSVKPSLVVELANPQFLLLFRSASFIFFTQYFPFPLNTACMTATTSCATTPCASLEHPCQHCSDKGHPCRLSCTGSWATSQLPLPFCHEFHKHLPALFCTI